jgi:hypothetical protein
MRKAFTNTNAVRVKVPETRVPMTRWSITNDELQQAGFKPHNAEDFKDFCVSDWHDEVFLKMETGSHVWLHGPAGSGKNLVADYIAYVTNRPYVVISPKVGANPNDSIKTVRLENGSTVEKLGEIAKAIQGVEIERDGEKMRVPAIICWSDADRCPPETLELLREALEVGKGWIADPCGGAPIRVMKGTQFILTANRGLDGDGGRGNITAPLDSALMTRSRAVRAVNPSRDWLIKALMKTLSDLSHSDADLLVSAHECVKDAAEQLGLGNLEVTLRDMIGAGKEFIMLSELNMGRRECLEFAMKGLTSKLADENNYEPIESSFAHLGDDLNPIDR